MTDPYALRFLEVIRHTLDKLNVDVQRHARSTGDSLGVGLPEAWDHCIARACEHLDRYRLAVELAGAKVEGERAPAVPTEGAGT